MFFTGKNYDEEATNRTARLRVLESVDGEGNNVYVPPKPNEDSSDEDVHLMLKNRVDSYLVLATDEYGNQLVAKRLGPFEFVVYDYRIGQKECHECNARKTTPVRNRYLLTRNEIEYIDKSSNTVDEYRWKKYKLERFYSNDCNKLLLRGIILQHIKNG
mmetsp:Transcript_42535/g.83623  ORF Transcript_42535/g.83623 Transcript_42535/m.83623 type:complete len:159 (-) Transcript_42535:26-502(-)